MKQLRRLFKQLEGFADELVRIKTGIELPDEEALSAMLSGRESLSSEGYLLAILHWAELTLEDISSISPLFRKRVLSNQFRRENCHPMSMDMREMLANALWARRIDADELRQRSQLNRELGVEDFARLWLVLPLLDAEGGEEGPADEA